jgi:hypothetical protein
MNLGVSSLFFELAVIFIPGFIWMKIHSRYGFKGEKTQFDLILNSFIFGVLSYAFLYMIYAYKGWMLKIFDLDSDSKKLLQPEIFPEIVAAVGISIIGGIVTLYVENHKLFTRLVQSIGATKPMAMKTFGILYSMRGRVQSTLCISEISSSVSLTPALWKSSRRVGSFESLFCGTLKCSTSRAPKCTACLVCTLPENAIISISSTR